MLFRSKGSRYKGRVGKYRVGIYGIGTGDSTGMGTTGNGNGAFGTKGGTRSGKGFYPCNEDVEDLHIDELV